MYRKIRLLSILLVLAGSAAAEKVHYVVLYEGRYPVQIVKDNDLLYGGYITEIVKAIFEGSEHLLVPVYRPVKRFVRGQKFIKENWLSYTVRGRPPSYDYMLEAVTATTDIARWDCVIVSLKATNFHFSGADSLINKKIAKVSAFNMPGLARAMDGRPYSLLNTIDQIALIKVLLSGRADAAISTRRSARYAIGAVGASDDLFYMEDCGHGTENFRVTLAMDSAMDGELIEFIKRRLAELKNNGVMNNILENTLTKNINFKYRISSFSQC